MTEENKEKPRSPSNTAPFAETRQFRVEAEQKAQAIPLPELESMSLEEIRQVIHEIQVKRLEAELQNERLLDVLGTYNGQVELFSILTENMRDIVTLTDTEGTIRFIGDSVKVCGYAPAFLLGKNVMDFVHPEDFPHVLAAHNELVASGNPGRLEYRLRCRDGSYLWVETRGAIHKEEHHHSQGLVFTTREITERKRAEEALREQTEFFRKISDNMFDLISIADLEGNYKYIGSSRNLLGYDPGTLTGKNFLEFIHPEDIHTLSTVFAEGLQKGEKSGKAEYRYKKADGEYLWLETIGKVIGDASGNPEEVIFSTKDITERKHAEEKNFRIQQRFDFALQATNTGLWDWNMQTGDVVFNAQWAAMAGYSLDELRPLTIQTWKDLCHPEDLGHAYALLEKCLEKESVNFEWEARVRHKDGSWVWVMDRAKVIEWDEFGRPFRMIGTRTDISDRKRSEQALSESEMRFRTMVENLPGGIFAHDLNGRIFLVNDRACKNTGYSRDELLHMPVWEIDPNAADPKVQKELWHELETGQSAPIESFHIRKDGTRYPAEIHLNGILLAGEPVILPVAFDITERKRIEAERAEQHALIRAIYRNAPLMMMVVDSTRRLRQVNGFAAQFAGRTVEEMLDLRGGEALRCLHALDDPRGCGFGRFCKDCTIRNKVLETLENGVAHLQAEASFNFSSGGQARELTLLVSTTPITFQGENMALVIMMDISERKQAEKEQKKLQAQLTQAQKMESVGRLAGGVAHDFNNMLTIINGYAQISIEMLDPAVPLYKNIWEILNAGKRSEGLVRQLLAFARRQTINPVPLDLNDTISNMLKMLQRLIGENIDLVWHPGSNLWQVKIDPSQVDQIMANFAVNAGDAISNVGRLIIETKNVVLDEAYCRRYSYFVPGKYVMLSVSDTGCGMEKEVQDNLFEPFFTTKGIGKGTGLGLSTIYGIVKQNNGFINVYSEPGQGTVFKVYLPPHEAQQAVATPNAKESARKMPSGDETILLVEDEPAILRMGREMLEKLGYTVLAAEKPEDALQLAKEHGPRIHLLITDVIMPEMNGRELASKLSGRFPGLRTLYMSGYTRDVIAHHGVLDEGVHFIQKPFSIQNLAVKVREAINGE